MKFNYYLLLFFGLSFFGINSQTIPNLAWAKQSGGQSNQAYALTIDTSGNVYTTGYFSGMSDFDPGPGTFTLTSTGAADIFILKLSPTGNFIWAKSIGGTGSDQGYSVFIDPSGNVISSGWYSGSVDFDPGAGSFSLTSAGSYDGYISKLDASGNFIWAKSIGGTSNDRATAIATDPNGNICIAGTFNGIADLDPGPAVSSFTAAGFSDIFVSKLSPSGNLIWVKSMAGSGADDPYSIAIDGSLNILTTGLFESVCDFDPSASTFTLASKGYGDIYVSKMDSAGNLLWAKSFGGPTYYDYGFAITTDLYDNVITAGDFGDTVDFNPGLPVYNLITPPGTQNTFVSKLDPSGNFIWAKQLGGNGTTASWGVDTDPMGSVYISGYFHNTTDLDPGPGTHTVTSQGLGDAFVTKLSSTGNFNWAQVIGNFGDDEAYGIAVNSQYEVYVNGYFNYSPDFDPGSAIYNLTASGSESQFIEKLNQCGSTPTNVTPLANKSICANNTTTLMATSTGTVNWFSSPTSTTALGTGTAYVTPTLSIGSYTFYAGTLLCPSSVARTSVVVSVSACTGIKTFSNEQQVMLYPNPLTEQLTVMCQTPLELKIEILNSLGEIVYNGILQNEKTEIRMKDLSPGIYFVHFSSNSEIFKTEKIIKQ